MQPIKISDLYKNYGSVRAVKGISLSVEKGTIYGLIGPDGAGKTTIIRILVSLLRPDAGEVLFLGKSVPDDPRRVRSRIGYMPQRFSLYRDLSVEQNLRFFGDLFQIPLQEQQKRMQQLYAFSQLELFRTRRAGALSGGMKQKLALSCMLMHKPEVIVLDEPTFGVDPVSRNEFWGILRHLSEDGTTIFVSTAYMDEARLCDRVGLIHEGRILAQDSPEILTRGFLAPIYQIKSDNPHQLYRRLEQEVDADQLQLFGSCVHVIDRSGSGISSFEDLLTEHHIINEGIEPVDPTLEHLFLELIR